MKKSPQEINQVTDRLYSNAERLNIIKAMKQENYFSQTYTFQPMTNRSIGEKPSINNFF